MFDVSFNNFEFLIESRYYGLIAHFAVLRKTVFRGIQTSNTFLPFELQFVKQIQMKRKPN